MTWQIMTIVIHTAIKVQSFHALERLQNADTVILESESIPAVPGLARKTEARVPGED